MNPFFEIKLEVPKHFVKKNSRNIFVNKKTGRAFPGKDKELIAMENFLTLCFKSARNEIFRTPPIIPIYLAPTNKGRVHMEAIFIFPKTTFFCQTKGKNGEPKGRRNSNIPDLSNLYEIVQDCLEAAGVIENDSQIDSHDGSRRLPGETFRLDLKLFAMP